MPIIDRFSRNWTNLTERRQRDRRLCRRAKRELSTKADIGAACLMMRHAFPTSSWIFDPTSKSLSLASQMRKPRTDALALCVSCPKAIGQQCPFELDTGRFGHIVIRS
jgi:hypothetical protein